MGMSTLSMMPCGLSADGPEAISVAPSKPPMSAWLLDDGIPWRHVIRFHVIAPISAAATTVVVDVASLTRPDPIVLATAVPANAPMKLNAVAMMMALRGESARVATDVAIALAVSWKPFV